MSAKTLVLAIQHHWCDEGVARRLLARPHARRGPRRSADGPGDAALLDVYACAPVAAQQLRAAADARRDARSLDEVMLSKRELLLIEALDFRLVVEHPYQHLEALLEGAWKRSGRALARLLTPTRRSPVRGRRAQWAARARRALLVASERHLPPHGPVPAAAAAGVCCVLRVQACARTPDALAGACRWSPLRAWCWPQMQARRRCTPASPRCCLAWRPRTCCLLSQTCCRRTSGPRWTPTPASLR